uniref:Uncharacterized protein n=1 Tax=Anguilla anguilla TaxID=7936 RepID=A0A0E9VI14_ANGAN
MRNIRSPPSTVSTALTSHPVDFADLENMFPWPYFKSLINNLT